MEYQKGLLTCLVVLTILITFSVGTVDTVDATDETGSTEYDLRLKIEGGGVVSYGPDAIDIQEIEDEDEWIFTYEEGTEVTLLAEPHENWEFVEWKEDIDGDQMNITFVIEGDMEVTAVFENDVIDEEDSPGFTLIPLAFSVVASIIIFYKKDERR